MDQLDEQGSRFLGIKRFEIEKDSYIYLHWIQYVKTNISVPFALMMNPLMSFTHG